MPIVQSGPRNLEELRSYREWKRPNASDVRECFLRGDVSQTMEEGTPGFEARKQAFDFFVDASVKAVRFGRMFDLGFLPNEAIKSESTRGVELYLEGHIRHPFIEPYIVFHHWEESSSVYLVIPNETGIGPMIACEYTAGFLQEKRKLILGDCVRVTPDRQKDGRPSFTAELVADDMHEMLARNGVISSATTIASNIADPVMAVILLLSTEGVGVKRVEVSEKLNKARRKNRKPEIPPYWRVSVSDYVTALHLKKNPSARKAGEPSGTHASPVPHLRRGHIRKLSEGRTTWVRDSLINLIDHNAPLARSFYQIQQEGKNGKTR